MKFRITESPEVIEEGSEINYSLQIGPVPITWTTRIDVWEDGVRFVDSQMKGPYASWWHEHRFEQKGETTAMTDRVFYSPPLGVLGKIANTFFIESELRQVFGYRAAIMRLRFG
jgi:ligand-binding SRPBCC domain-containing protein